ncbi:MAG: hypothetical protein AAB250_11725 [Bdellovibrionota bacterium]
MNDRTKPSQAIDCRAKSLDQKKKRLGESMKPIRFTNKFTGNSPLDPQRPTYWFTTIKKAKK